MEAGADLEQRGRRGRASRCGPVVGQRDPRKQLQQRALAGAVAADQADDLARRDLERDVAQRPERLASVGASSLSGAGEPARAARWPSARTAARRGARSAAVVALAEALDADRAARSSLRSRPRSSRSARSKYRPPAHEQDAADRSAVTSSSSPGNVGSGQHHPAHQLEHADHRVEPVERLVGVRDEAERIDDRRDEQAERAPRTARRCRCRGTCTWSAASHRPKPSATASTSGTSSGHEEHLDRRHHAVDEQCTTSATTNAIAKSTSGADTAASGMTQRAGSRPSRSAARSITVLVAELRDERVVKNSHSHHAREREHRVRHARRRRSMCGQQPEEDARTPRRAATGCRTAHSAPTTDCL